MPITLYLIRHGESMANAGAVTYAPDQIALTELGRQQAEEVPRNLPKRIDYIIYSSFTRAKSTALPTIQLHPESKISEWESIREFTYLDPKSCIGTNMEDRRSRVDSYWSACNPNYKDSQDAESFVEFMDRIHLTLDCLNTYNNTTIAMFTHALFMKAFLRIQEGHKDTAGELMKMFFNLHYVANCQIFKISL